jgi:hypothetical protein
VLHTADYALAWPKDLFLDEAQVLLWDRTDGPWIGRAEFLLEEAFTGPAPRDALRDDSLPGAWDAGPRGVIEALMEQADQLRQAAEPRPYWSQRRGGTVPPMGVEAVMDAFVRLVGDLAYRGYFERVFPSGCVDDRGFYAPDPSGELQNRLGQPDLWPLQTSRSRWDQDLFFDLVEVLHDLVARPRSRSFHDYGGCGWHYSNFALEPGRRLYRWEVNRLLSRSTLAFRLAEEGEDVGRLVAVTDDARAQLVASVAQRSNATADRVRHALALVRARGASEHDKRSAIVTLAGVLEERRELLKQRLSRKDEAALFQIANQFALRHQRANQLADYDVAFLDWVFWWYLATVELSDRLLGRTEAPQP